MILNLQKKFLYLLNVLSIISVLFQISVVLYVTIPISPIFVDIIIPLNKSRYVSIDLAQSYNTEKDEHFYLIVIYYFCFLENNIISILPVEFTHLLLAYHYCALFGIIRYDNKKILFSLNFKKKFYFSVIAYEEQLIVIRKKILRMMKLIELIGKFAMQWKLIRVSSRY